jgi:hypothetical protein
MNLTIDEAAKLIRARTGTSLSKINLRKLLDMSGLMFGIGKHPKTNPNNVVMEVKTKGKRPNAPYQFSGVLLNSEFVEKEIIGDIEGFIDKCVLETLIDTTNLGGYKQEKKVMSSGKRSKR